MYFHALLCTHGTRGARQAEAYMFDKLARHPKIKLTVLTVLDEDWRLMTGDDWLNSSKTHTKFLDHVEEQVSSEIAEEWQRIKTSYPAAGNAAFVQRTGAIAKTICTVAREKGCDVIVIGPYQKSKPLFSLQMEKGLRSRMENKTLHPMLPCPLLIIPS